MVRREEQPWQSRATLVLDNRVAGHSARQPGRQTPQTSSLEWAVTAAASIGTHLLARGYSVRLVTDEGGSTSTAWHDHSEGPGSAEGLLLEALATVEISSKASVGTVRSMLHGAGTASGLLVAVVGAMDADELASMTRLRHDTSAALALVLDVGQWPGGQAADATGLPAQAVASTLARAGWHAVVAGAGERSADEVAAAWGRLAEGVVTAPTDPGVPADPVGVTR